MLESLTPDILILQRMVEHMNWKEHKKQLMEDPKFRKEYEALELEHQLIAILTQLRLAKRLIQASKSASYPLGNERAEAA